MQIAGSIRSLICLASIATASCWIVPAASAADDEVCVRGSGDAAIDACTRLINSGRFDRRNLALIYSNRANQKERKGEYDKAMLDHAQAIKTDPTYAAGFMHRGNAYARHGDFERAIADHNEAIRLGPQDADAFYNRGFTFSHKGDHERAIADYTIGIGLDSKNPRLWGQRCWSRAVTGSQLKDAIEDCNKARDLAPKIPQILAYRGLVYLKLGQSEQAVADYDAALALTRNPDNAEWLYVRGVAKLRKGDTNSGNADIERARTIKADIADEYAKYGVK
jgi:tetratricopeptide (TPR) repeat protein